MKGSLSSDDIFVTESLRCLKKIGLIRDTPPVCWETFHFSWTPEGKYQMLPSPKMLRTGGDLKTLGSVSVVEVATSLPL